MKRIYSAVISSVLFTPATFGGACTVGTQHCYHNEAVPSEVFDNGKDCGLNTAELMKCTAKFCRDVKFYAETEEGKIEADQKGDADLAARLREELKAYIPGLMEAGMKPEQIASIPSQKNFVCKPVLSPEQRRKALQLHKLGERKIQIKLLYKGQYPVTDVFDDKTPRNFDLCKIDRLIKGDRGGVTTTGNSLATGLKLFANNKQNIQDLESIPGDYQFKTDSLNGLYAKKIEFYKDFADVGITPEELIKILPTREFEDHVRNVCNIKPKTMTGD